MPNLDITISDAAGAQKNKVSVPGDKETRRVIAAIVDKLNLPLHSPDGTPMSYKFHHQETSRQIKDENTLIQSGVSDGDTLRLIPEIVAG